MVIWVVFVVTFIVIIIFLYHNAMIIFTRINHSCAPNSAWSWIASDPRKRKKVVRAVREVASSPEWIVKNEKVILMMIVIFR